MFLWTVDTVWYHIIAEYWVLTPGRHHVRWWCCCCWRQLTSATDAVFVINPHLATSTNRWCQPADQQTSVIFVVFSTSVPFLFSLQLIHVPYRHFSLVRKLTCGVNLNCEYKKMQTKTYTLSLSSASSTKLAIQFAGKHRPLLQKIDFFYFLHWPGTLGSKFVMKWSLKIPQYLKHVAELLCEI